jgi:hypothetical protein
MRDAAGLFVTPKTQGLTMRLRYKQMNRENREISGRKQVGDAESIVNEGSSSLGTSGFFGEEGQIEKEWEGKHVHRKGMSTTI